MHSPGRAPPLPHARGPVTVPQTRRCHPGPVGFFLNECSRLLCLWETSSVLDCPVSTGISAHSYCAFWAVCKPCLLPFATDPWALTHRQHPGLACHDRWGATWTPTNRPQSGGQVAAHSGWGTGRELFRGS